MKITDEQVTRLINIAYEYVDLLRSNKNSSKDRQQQILSLIKEIQSQNLK